LKNAGVDHRLQELTAGFRINAWGDHVGHTALLGEGNAAHLAVVVPWHETVAAIEGGDGTGLVRDFLVWAVAHQVQVVGGLPADFAEWPMPPATRRAIGAVFATAGAGFIDLGTRARYPRAAFFDTPDHLNEAAQIDHSRGVAAALAAFLARAPLPGLPGATARTAEWPLAPKSGAVEPAAPGTVAVESAAPGPGAVEPASIGSYRGARTGSEPVIGQAR
jgi:hypothetical protein